MFKQLEIKSGDFVIGIKKGYTRLFKNPSMVLDIKDNLVLVLIDNEKTEWLPLRDVQKVYISEENKEQNSN